MEAVIFDFNGTLFWDTDKHVYAWKLLSEKLRGYPFTHEEDLLLTGRTNYQLLEYIYGHPLDKEEADRITLDKEAFYRDLVRKDKENSHLAPGAPELLSYLRDNKVPITVATSSEVTNVNFFIEFFNLKEYFDTSKFTFDEGKFPGKPAPDIYILAAKKIGVDPSKCIVFEDTASGIKSAHSAGIGQIYAIVTDVTRDKLKDLPGVTGVIEDFNQFDRSVLKINQK